MSDYVNGFLFAQNAAFVLLIEKQKPLWQRGLWNGIGGHIESGESSWEAMNREFREEAGIERLVWTQQLSLLDNRRDHQVDFYMATVASTIPLQQLTPERLSWHALWKLPRVVPNLRWIIPFMLDQHVNGPVEVPCNLLGDE